MAIDRGQEASDRKGGEEAGGVAGYGVVEGGMPHVTVISVFDDPHFLPINA